MDHASDQYYVGGLVAISALIILTTITIAQRGKDFFIRRIAGLNAIDEAVGRATETGRPILMVPGYTNLGAISPQPLIIFSSIIKATAQFGNRILMTCAYPMVYTVAQKVTRDS